MMFDNTEKEAYIQDRVLFNDIIGKLLLGKIIINKDGKIIFCNDVISKETGYSKFKLYGMDIGDLMKEGENLREKHNDFLKGFFDDPHPIDMRKLEMIGRDGKEISVKIKIRELIIYPSSQGMIQYAIKKPTLFALATVIWQDREL